MDWMWFDELPVEPTYTLVQTKKRRRLDGIRRRGPRSSSPRKNKRAIVWKKNLYIWIPGKLQIVAPSLKFLDEFLTQPMSPPTGLIYADRGSAS